jgi:hypothetical protein
MGSNAKKKTTFAKLERERRLRERRAEKNAKKAARKQAAADEADEAVSPSATLTSDDG